mgnify:CR=1 FL=1
MNNYLRVFLTQLCWFQNCPYSKEWDNKLNDLLKTENFIIVQEGYKVRLNEYIIWVANHPYNSFTIILCGYEVRPKRITILKAMDKLQKDMLNSKIDFWQKGI